VQNALAAKGRVQRRATAKKGKAELNDENRRVIGARFAQSGFAKYERRCAVLEAQGCAKQLLGEASRLWTANALQVLTLRAKSPIAASRSDINIH